MSKNDIIKGIIEKKQAERIDEFVEPAVGAIVKYGSKAKNLGKKAIEKAGEYIDDTIKGFEKPDQPSGPTVKPGTAPELPHIDSPSIVPELPNAPRVPTPKGPRTSPSPRVQPKPEVKSQTVPGAKSPSRAKPELKSPAEPKAELKTPNLRARAGAGGAAGAAAGAVATTALGGLGGPSVSATDPAFRKSRVPVKTSASLARKRSYYEEFTVNSAPTPKKREDDPGILRPKDSQKKPTTLFRKTEILRKVIEEERALAMASMDMKRLLQKKFGMQHVPQDVHGNPLTWLRYTETGSPFERNLKSKFELGGKKFEKLETALRYFKNANKNLISAGKKKLKEETKVNAVKQAIEDERKKRLKMQNPYIEVNPKIKTDSKNTDNISIDLYN